MKWWPFPIVFVCALAIAGAQPIVNSDAGPAAGSAAPTSLPPAATPPTARPPTTAPPATTTPPATPPATTPTAPVRPAPPTTSTGSAGSAGSADPTTDVSGVTAGSGVGSASASITEPADGPAAGSAEGSAVPLPAPDLDLDPPPTPAPAPTPQAADSSTDTSAPTSPLVAPDAGTGDAAASTSTGDQTLTAIKVIIGLILLVVLAYLGGHRRVVRFQERLGVSGVITAGFPFVALGLLASEPSIGILSPEVIDRMRPLLHFGLGWLGFIIGAQLDIRVLDRVPKGTAYLILVEAMGPFAITAAGCGAVMMAFGVEWNDPTLWRDMILLGTAAAMTAPRKFRGFANRTWHEGRGADVLLGQLDELVGVLGLLFITAYFRVSGDSSTWQIPNTAWVFVSIGLGVAIGVLIFALVRVPKSNAEFLAVVLGSIAFASGLAGYLHLSPIVVCFLAGVLVTNFPNDQRDNVFRILNHLERPVHMLFLIVAGAVWDVTDWRGWVIVPLFVIGRVAGKYVGIIASKTAVGSLLPAGFVDRRQLVQPMSGLSIALVISVASLYADTGLAWVLTAVIGGAMLNELLVQATTKDNGARQEEPAPAAPIDELDEFEVARDELDGPVYPDDAPPPTGDKP